MNNKKIYAAPVAECILFAPRQDVATNSAYWSWKLPETLQNNASVFGEQIIYDTWDTDEGWKFSGS